MTFGFRAGAPCADAARPNANEDAAPSAPLRNDLRFSAAMEHLPRTSHPNPAPTSTPLREDAQMIRHHPLEIRQPMIDRRIDHPRLPLRPPRHNRARPALVQPNPIVHPTLPHHPRELTQRRPFAVVRLLPI